MSSLWHQVWHVRIELRLLVVSSILYPTITVISVSEPTMTTQPYGLPCGAPYTTNSVAPSHLNQGKKSEKATSQTLSASSVMSSCNFNFLYSWKCLHGWILENLNMVHWILGGIFLSLLLLHCRTMPRILPCNIGKKKIAHFCLHIILGFNVLIHILLWYVS